MQEIAPSLFRSQIRSGVFNGPTAGYCPGFIQANLIVLPRQAADSFAGWCQQNSKECPLLTHFRGCIPPREWAVDADIRLDLGAYKIFKHGQFISEKPSVDINEDCTSFLIGCSFSFDHKLISNGIPVRNVEQGRNVSMYITNQHCKSVDCFNNVPVVVSMRPIPQHLVDDAIRLTHEVQCCHGAPLGTDPGALGISDLDKPDFGDSVVFQPGDVPVFWACGVTGMMAIQSAKNIPWAVSHSPGHMFVTDVEI